MSGKTVLTIGILCLGGLLFFTGCLGPTKAELKFSLKEYSAAIPLYEEYLAENPGDSVSKSKLGFSYFKTGNLEKAVDIFNSVLKDSPLAPKTCLTTIWLPEPGWPMPIFLPLASVRDLMSESLATTMWV